MTYAGLALTFLVVPAALALAAAFVVRPSRTWWTATAATLVALLVLTAVFDSLMIAVDLFRFDESRLLGVFVGEAPVEDFAWPLASVLALPALWELLRRRVGRDASSHTPAASPAPEVLATLLGSSRPLSWVNTAYPFAAAYLLAGGGLDLGLVLGTLYFLVPYNLLMYGINDVFDYESDLRNARKGGVEGVVLDQRLHRTTLWAAGLSNAPFLVALLVMGTPISALVLGVVTFAVVAYSAPGLRFKERPFLDSVTSSTHFAGPAAFGLALAGASLSATVVFAMVSFFLWGMASQAFGAVQDIVADREVGIGSIGTVIGAAHTVRIAMVLYAAAGLAAIGTGWPGMLAGLLCLPYLVNIARFASLPDERAEEANAGWRTFLWLNYVVGFFVTQLFIWILR